MKFFSPIGSTYQKNVHLVYLSKEYDIQKKLKKTLNFDETQSKDSILFLIFKDSSQYDGSVVIYHFQMSII